MNRIERFFDREGMEPLVISSPGGPTIFDVNMVKMATDALPEMPYLDAVEALILRPSMMMQQLNAVKKMINSIESPSWEPPPELYRYFQKEVIDSYMNKDTLLEFFEDQREKLEQALELQSQLKDNRLQACTSSRNSREHGYLVSGVKYHPVLAAIHLACTGHRPLVLSPDIIWLMVLQGLANHINTNAEELRSQLYKQSGKIALSFRRDDFYRYVTTNPWSELFDGLTNQVRQYMGETTHDYLLPTFSTTSTMERTAAQVMFLDSLPGYFTDEHELEVEYSMPQIVLEGTVEDWKKLAERTHEIGRFGLTWWTEVLAPLLQEFVAAAGGKVNLRFWRSIYKLDESRNTTTRWITGWITMLFPYLRDTRTGWASDKNHFIESYGKSWKEFLNPSGKSDDVYYGHSSLTPMQLPTGMARAPFRWHHHYHFNEMEFLAGFVGVEQEAGTMRLRPKIGCVVREAL